MPRRGERLSEAQRRRIGEGSRRGQQRWLRGLGVQPVHVRRFIASNHVHASLRGLLAEAIRETGELVALLGGEPTAAQRVLVGLWTAQRTAELASLERWLGSAKPQALLAVSAHGNACARLLSQLGLSRAEAGGEDEALEAYRRALRTRSDRGSGTACDGGSSPAGNAGFPRPAVSDSALGVSGGERSSLSPAASRASSPTNRERR